jgi:hypothetical protein
LLAPPLELRFLPALFREGSPPLAGQVKPNHLHLLADLGTLYERRQEPSRG